MSPLLSRKFILCMAALATSSVLVWHGKISDQVFSTVLLATVGAYVVGNVTQKATAKPMQADGAPQ